MAKYIVTRSDGTPIPEDEPCFIIRAKDIFALAVLNYYRGLTAGTAPMALTREMDLHYARMQAWRWANADKIKVPD